MKETILPAQKCNINISAEDSITVLEYWNFKTNISMPHRKPESKVYANSIRYIATLLEGGQAQRFELDEDYRASYGITEKDMNKKWSVEELCQAIDRFDYMCSSKYIADKTYYPKNMPDFIYNFRTQKSFIMTILGEWKDVSGAPAKPLNIGIVNVYKNEFFNHVGEDMYNKLIKMCNYLVLQQQAFQERVGQYCHWHPLKGDGFFRHHIQYIQLTYQDREDFRTDHIGPMTYQGFPLWLKEFHNIELNPLNQEISKMKERFEVEKIIIRENEEREHRILSERLEWAKNRVFEPRVCSDTIFAVEPLSVSPVKSEEKLENSLK